MINFRKSNGFSSVFTCSVTYYPNPTLSSFPISGDCADDEQTSTFVYGFLGGGSGAGASNSDSSSRVGSGGAPVVAPVVVFPAAAASDVQGEEEFLARGCEKPLPTFPSFIRPFIAAEVEFLRAEPPEPVAAPSAATASINPQRTATASIKLSPAAASVATPPGSPRVASRARSKSPNPR